MGVVTPGEKKIAVELSREADIRITKLSFCLAQTPLA